VLPSPDIVPLAQCYTEIFYVGLGSVNTSSLSMSHWNDSRMKEHLISDEAICS